MIDCVLAVLWAAAIIQLIQHNWVALTFALAGPARLWYRAARWPRHADGGARREAPRTAWCRGYPNAEPPVRTVRADPAESKPRQAAPKPAPPDPGKRQLIDDIAAALVSMKYGKREAGKLAKDAVAAGASDFADGIRKATQRKSR